MALPFPTRFSLDSRSGAVIAALLVALGAAACGPGDSTSDSAGTTAGSTVGVGGGDGGGATTTSSTTAGSGGDSSGGGGNGTGGTGGNGTGGGGAGGVEGAWCSPIPACDAAPPDPGPKGSWNHKIESPIIVATGFANHRGRDLLLNPGDPQWVLGKFAYGIADKDLKGEDVDIYLLRDCGNAWEKLGAAMTTEEDTHHPTVEGVEDTGGRIYFEIPANQALGPGRHRIRMVVKGDHSTAEQFIEVVPPGAPVFVSDVDGTLTTQEYAEFGALLLGQLPDVHPDAAKAFDELVAKGYHPIYLTARPEWLTGRTREFLDAKGFPPGIVHTTLSLTGATGDAAFTYKSGELEALADKGLVPDYGFGNTDSDAAAYDAAAIAPLDHRIFYQFDDVTFGGRRIEEYTELLGEFGALPSLCP